MSDFVRLEATVSGYVQGVGFRDWVRRAARPLGLAGSATNLADGRVEVVAEGTRDACEGLLRALSGPTPGTVDSLDHAWSDATGIPDGFRLG